MSIHDITRLLGQVRVSTMSKYELEIRRAKKSHHICRSPNFDSNLDKKQKKGQNDNGLILGRIRVMPHYSAE